MQAHVFCKQGHLHRSQVAAETCDVAWRHVARRRLETETLRAQLREVLAAAKQRNERRKPSIAVHLTPKGESKLKTAKEMESLLMEIFEGIGTGEVPVGDVRSVRTYRDAGMLTQDQGVVVIFRDGTDYLISIFKAA